MKTKAIFMLIALFFFGGCSTFENSAVYMDRTKGSQVIDYKNDVAELRLQFNPDVNFVSAGVLGAPLIPLYFKIAKSDEVVLSIELSVFQNKNFSAIAKPCLRINNNEEFCPEHLIISAVGMRDIGSIDPGGHTWVQIRNFQNTEDINIDLKKVLGTDELDRNHILQHYKCTDEERLGYLRVFYTYIYKCNGGCPKRIEFNLRNIINIDGLSIEDRDQIFEKTQHNRYEVMTILQ